MATSMVLDIVELSKRHTGYNLAEACAEVMKDFGIEKKVSLESMDKVQQQHHSPR